jgi:hypothetical protein
MWCDFSFFFFLDFSFFYAPLEKHITVKHERGAIDKLG